MGNKGSFLSSEASGA